MRCFVELNLKRTKWLSYSYNPNRSNIYSQFDSLSGNLDLYSSKYDNYLKVSDFNISVEEANIKNFWKRFGLKNLIKDPTCYKNPNNPCCIDLMLKNKVRRFQRSCVIETGLSDFHKMTITILKMWFCKLEPKVVSYRNYEFFSNDTFLKSLNSE